MTYAKLKTVHYRVYCLEVLQQRFQALSSADQAEILKILAPFGDFDLGEVVESGMAGEFEFPIKPQIQHPARFEKLLLTATGTLGICHVG